MVHILSKPQKCSIWKGDFNICYKKRHNCCRQCDKSRPSYKSDVEMTEAASKHLTADEDKQAGKEIMTASKDKAG